MGIHAIVGVLVAISTLAALAGCGEKTVTETAKDTLHISQNCIDCHENNPALPGTPGTGGDVATDWKNSAHNTSNSRNISGSGASCINCHGSGYLHPFNECNRCHGTAGTGSNPVHNPDADGACARCHNKVNQRNLSDGFKFPFTDAHGSAINQSTSLATPFGTTYNNIPTGVPLGVPANSSTRFVHFSTGLRANYVATNYKLNCRKCHHPHDTTYGREQRKQWAESGHGSTRGLARIGLDAKGRGTSTPLNLNYSNANYCVRCHTSTGFINFVNSGFTYVEALPDLDGYKANFPVANYTYKDTSREATNCDVCHLDTNGASSYSGRVRPVALQSGVTIFYPYSGKNSRAVTRVDYDTLGNSNLCLTCHSGRAAGNTIKGINTTYRKDSLGNDMTLDFTKSPGRPSSHDFAGGAVLQARKSMFFYYTSTAKYKAAPAHISINIDNNGPCISCHMPRIQSNLSGGTIHSHLFRPVTWNNDDINDSITDIISNAPVCSSCHTGPFISHDIPYALDKDVMNSLRKGFRAAVTILGKLVPGSSNWTGAYGNSPRSDSMGNHPAGAYTMGASFNQTLLLNEPSAYNHNPILVRQIIYDSIDWLANGKTTVNKFGQSPLNVYNAIAGTALSGSTWAKASPIAGAILGDLSNKTYITFTDNDKEDAFEFICKGYLRNTYTNDKLNSGNIVCERW